MPVTEGYLYSNFFSTAAIIASSMNCAVVLYFLLVPKRERATSRLMLVYLSIAFQNLGYVVASSVYHPLAAYHRWLTVGAVLPGLIYMVQFFYAFPEERAPRFARVLLVAQWIVALAVDVVFIRASLNAPTRFHFDGHYWDFDLDPLSYTISLVIMAYIGLVLVTGLWRTVVTRDHRRWHVAALLGCFMIITVVPGVLNTLSRTGVLDRELFQIIWNLVTVLGFFLTATVYINVTRNRNTVMANIVGITLVSFLLVLQGLSYVTSRDGEAAYDQIHRLETARLAIDPGYRPADLAATAHRGLVQSPEPEALPAPARALMHNTLLYERIAALDAAGFVPPLRALLAAAPPEASGYAQALLRRAADPAPHDPRIRERILAEALRLSDMAEVRERRLRDLPAAEFRNAAMRELARGDAGFRRFAAPIIAWLEATPDATAEQLAARLAPLRPAGTRYYRTAPDGRHLVVYHHADVARGTVIEASFSYAHYRRFINESSMKLLYLFFMLVGILVLAFPLFFLGTLIRPLRNLLQGVRRVKSGNLDAMVPVTMEDEIGYLTGAFNDMVDSVRSARQEIFHMNHYLKNIIDSMPSILVSVDEEGRITHWNQAAEHKTGVPEDQARGRLLADLIPQLEQYMERIRHAIRSREPDRLEKIIYREAGEIRYADLLLYPLIADGVDGVVVRIDDTTARVRLEEMMIQTEKMMSVGGLAAGMAHEINNPLGGILMAAQNIFRRITPGLSANIEAAREIGVDFDQVTRYIERRDIMRMLETIKVMGDRASSIVNNMLNFSRRSESRMTHTDLAELLTSTVELAASDYDLKKKYDFRHIVITREFDENLPPVACVRVEIQQVLLNLLKNAAQAIQLKVYPADEQPRIILRLYRHGERAVMEVEDNGPGMPPEVRKRIFEPFFTTKETGVGTGLGLSVSYFIITDNHKGSITVDSRPGGGTRFTITIPISSSAELRPPAV